MCDTSLCLQDHLCKPNMEQDPYSTSSTHHDFDRWKAAISQMAKREKVYMKLSGAFSEITDQSHSAPMTAKNIAQYMRPWLDHIFAEFGVSRIMFGSDWPVCNVRGPGDSKSWGLWVEVVAQIMESRGLSELEQNRIWHGTAIQAYRLEV
jgi:L-rhamnono-1,4-lactonase